MNMRVARCALCGGFIAMDKTTQAEINSSEWRNPDHWGEPKHAGMYFSKKDSRIGVPKRDPSMGWTLNLGHRYALFCLLGIFGLFFMLGLLIGGSFTSVLMNAAANP